jgi:hypothetical protein
MPSSEERPNFKSHRCLKLESIARTSPSKARFFKPPNRYGERRESQEERIELSPEAKKYGLVMEVIEQQSAEDINPVDASRSFVLQ